MRHERINQEKKDKKVLDILQFKDQQIEDLQLRLQTSEDAYSALREKSDAKMVETQAQLEKFSA